eukprot:CAMPEP_0177638112 /NCGR_PEP_ID=MMETSP0447-20121125/5318_1 /TAXON_ID=0 /ORGANISM="Stygamoeba regulata, Strain BSH-02190019" /LENGTH=315 /DNA_ID=CAMNT_0019140059 /DNA_START=30 /DNA_END=973 /DNA_ORIENTATION=+
MTDSKSPPGQHIPRMADRTTGIKMTDVEKKKRLQKMYGGRVGQSKKMDKYNADQLSLEIARLMKCHTILQKRLREVHYDEAKEGNLADIQQITTKDTKDGRRLEIIKVILIERNQVESKLLQRRKALLEVFRILMKKKAKYMNCFDLTKKSQRALCDGVPKIKVAESRYQPIAALCGPGEEEQAEEYEDWACALTKSSYPTLPGQGRSGDPICDRFTMEIHNNRIVACVADGCNWGVAPATAAKIASSTFVYYARENWHRMKDTKRAALHALHAIASAHHNIVRCQQSSDAWNAGTTTIIGGYLLELDTDLFKQR